jgi:hypothetical protein
MSDDSSNVQLWLCNLNRFVVVMIHVMIWDGVNWSEMTDQARTTGAGM